MKFTFGTKLTVQRTPKTELHPNTPVLTMVAPSTEGQRKARKFELNSTAATLLGITDDQRTIAFAWANDLNTTTGYITLSDGELNGSIKLNKNHDTFSNKPLADSLQKHYGVSEDTDNYFELQAYEGETPEGTTFYTLVTLTTEEKEETTAEEVVLNTGEDEALTVETVTV